MLKQLFRVKIDIRLSKFLEIKHRVMVLIVFFYKLHNVCITDMNIQVKLENVLYLGHSHHSFILFIENLINILNLILSGSLIIPWKLNKLSQHPLPNIRNCLNTQLLRIPMFFLILWEHCVNLLVYLLCVEICVPEIC